MYLDGFRETPLVTMSDDVEALADTLPRGTGFRRDGVGSPGMLEGSKRLAEIAMMENPYESPRSQPSILPGPSRQTGSRRIRLSVFLAHCLLLVLFPPGCCPCGFGLIGFLFLPYMLLLGLLPFGMIVLLFSPLIAGKLPGSVSAR